MADAKKCRNFGFSGTYPAGVACLSRIRAEKSDIRAGGAADSAYFIQIKKVLRFCADA